MFFLYKQLLIRYFCSWYRFYIFFIWYFAIYLLIHHKTLIQSDGTTTWPTECYAIAMIQAWLPGNVISHNNKCDLLRQQLSLRHSNMLCRPYCSSNWLDNRRQEMNTPFKKIKQRNLPKTKAKAYEGKSGWTQFGYFSKSTDTRAKKLLE